MNIYSRIHNCPNLGTAKYSSTGEQITKCGTPDQEILPMNGKR